MSRGVIASLRDFVPIRPLTRAESFRIAELQATRFLRLTNEGEPPVADSAIAELPKVHVQSVSPLPVSGAAQWSNGRWVVLLNAGESRARQRFSLAHEFKHILDNRFIDVLYADIPTAERAEFVERICDYFAGCLMVPRQWLKRAWGEGVQSPAALAARFGVSQPAIKVRLSQVGLGVGTARCNRSGPRWRLPGSSKAGTQEGYSRRQLLRST